MTNISPGCRTGLILERALVSTLMLTLSAYSYRSLFLKTPCQSVDISIELLNILSSVWTLSRGRKYTTCTIPILFFVQRVSPKECARDRHRHILHRQQNENMSYAFRPLGYSLIPAPPRLSKDSPLLARYNNNGNLAILSLVGAVQPPV
jgi:hypothetical protein